jgi:hypothetical protein
MPNVFLCYRRADTAPYAGRLYDALSNIYGVSQVFMDVTAIQPGVDFAGVIRQQISRVDSMLVIIGPRWLDAADAGGRARIHAPDDPVRQEIEAALDAGAQIVPILVAGAAMPASSALPPALARLADRNAIEMRDGSWQRDVLELRRLLGASTREKHSEGRWRATSRFVWTFCVVSILAVFALIPYLGRDALLVVPFAGLVAAVIFRVFVSAKYPLDPE